MRYITSIYIDYLAGIRNHRIIFGNPYKTLSDFFSHGNSYGRTLFIQNQIVAYERWESNKYGTINWSVFVFETVAPPISCQRIPGVDPGANLLLHLRGVRKVKRFLTFLDNAKKYKIDPAAIDKNYYYHLSNRLELNVTPIPYFSKCSKLRYIS